jgi:glycosyltransferase involved in cell wall biosynthesis
MNKPIKVLHVIYALSGGGAERQLQLLIKRAPDGYKHAVLCAETRDVELNKLNAEIFLHQRKGKFDWALYRSSYKAIKSFCPDVIHLWLPPVLTIPVMVVGALFRKPMIFSYRSRMSFDRLLNIIEYGLALFFSTKVISNNDVRQSTKLYQFLYNIKNGIVLPNGLDFSEVLQKDKFHVRESEPVKMIVVGRLVKEKNILNLINALALLPTKNNWLLNIYGEGYLKQECINLATSLGLLDRIIFNAFDKNIYAKIKDSDLLVMPSISEGMPNVLVEALSIKIPVVASNIPAIMAVVEDSQAVILVDPHNVQSIADGIEQYLNNQSQFIGNVDKGFMIAKKYDSQLMSLNYHKEYDNLISGA